MLFKPKDTDYEDEEEDFYDTPHSEAPPKPVKVPYPRPDDPKYYDLEDEWEHLRPASRNPRLWLWAAAVGTLLCAFITLWLLFLHPYEDSAIQYGYVDHIERRGEIFKTFEGTLMPYKSLTDTIEPYRGDLRFSLTDDHQAALLRRLYLNNRPVRVEYKRFHKRLPWRGESNVIITRVDSTDPSKILPPHLQRHDPGI